MPSGFMQVLFVILCLGVFFCRAGCRSNLQSEICLSSILCNGENEGCLRGGVERGEVMLARRVCGAELGTSISSISMTLGISVGP